MSNEQECDGSRPACDAAMAQLAATQFRAAAAERELDIAAENITQTMLRSREFMISAEQADAHADAAENLLRRVLACALVGHEADALRQDIQQALVRSHIVRQTAEKETGMPDFDVEEQLATLSAEIKTQRARADALSDTLSRWHEAIDAACDAAGVAMADSQNAHQEPLARLAALAQEARLWRGHFSASEKDEARSFHANLQLAQDCAAEKARADALAQQVADVRRFLQSEADHCPLCHGKGEFEFIIPNSTGTALKVCGQCASVRQALARLDAQKEEAMPKNRPGDKYDVSGWPLKPDSTPDLSPLAVDEYQGKWAVADAQKFEPLPPAVSVTPGATMTDSAHSEPPAVSAPQQRVWWVEHDSKVLRYGWACRITNGEESLWLEPGDAERIAAALNDGVTYRALLREVLNFRYHLSAELVERIRAAVEGGNDAD